MTPTPLIAIETLFKPFPKMPRLSREIIITEKLDGTNASIFVGDNGEFLVGSRTRWITPQDDNFGFAKWAYDRKAELMLLGPGHHFGEWWGKGIQRNYGLSERQWSLFNVGRWCLSGSTPDKIPSNNPSLPVKYQEFLPACCDLVPVLYRGVFNTLTIDAVANKLSEVGSQAVPGFMNPEGIIVFHIAGNFGFKKTLKDDGVPKSLVG